MKQIRVHAVYYKDRKEWLLYYRDPTTKRRIFKSTGINGKDAKSKSDANEAASNWQKEVRESQSNISWENFRRRYEDEVCSGLAKGTDRKVFGLFNAVEAILKPTRLNEITADAVSRFQSEMRTKQWKGKRRSESTIASHLRHLKAALRWAVDVGLLASAPKFKMPQRASTKMKGRPITREEFERMLAKVEAGLQAVTTKRKTKPGTTPKRRAVSEAVRATLREKRTKAIAAAAESWRYYMEGLWWSGLRLAESLQLYWDRPNKLQPILNGEDSRIAIPAELEKGNKDREIPMAPEFAEFLERTPIEQRRGPVFRPIDKEGRRASAEYAGKVIRAIGKVAGVVVEHDSDGKPKKFASAHDFRRAFAERWSSKIEQHDLMELMRHDSIQTTMRFYVGRNTRRTTKSLWAAYRKNNPDVAMPRQQKRQQHPIENPTDNRP